MAVVEAEASLQSANLRRSEARLASERERRRRRHLHRRRGRRLKAPTSRALALLVAHRAQRETERAPTSWIGSGPASERPLCVCG